MAGRARAPPFVGKVWYSSSKYYYYFVMYVYPYFLVKKWCIFCSCSVVVVVVIVVAPAAVSLFFPTDVPKPFLPCATQEREEKCMAGLKDRYRQHHAAILHGQTAFDAVLAEEPEDTAAAAADDDDEGEGAEEGGVASQQLQGPEQQQGQGQGQAEGGLPAGAGRRPLSTSGVENAPITLWPSAPTSA